MNPRARKAALLSPIPSSARFACCRDPHAKRAKPERCSWIGERARLGRSGLRSRGPLVRTKRPHRSVQRRAHRFGAGAHRTTAGAAALPFGEQINLATIRQHVFVILRLQVDALHALQRVEFVLLNLRLRQPEESVGHANRNCDLKQPVAVDGRERHLIPSRANQ